MKQGWKLAIAFPFILTGCIGEDYDFSPPTVSVENPDNIYQTEMLTETNVDWPYDEQYNKETKDILSFSQRQDKIHFASGRQIIVIRAWGF